MDNQKELIIRLPVPDPAEGVDVFWSAESRCRLRVAGNTVTVQGNTAAFMDLGKQLIALAMAEKGDHVHLDDFFCGSALEGGYELILSKDLD